MRRSPRDRGRRVRKQESPALCDCMRAQSCLTLCHPLDCRPPDSSAHGILQARVLEWVPISSSRVSSQSRDLTRVSGIFCIASGFFTPEPPGANVKASPLAVTLLILTCLQDQATPLSPTSNIFHGLAPPASLPCCPLAL